MNAKELAARIDHTLLRAEATASELEAVCGEAIEFGCASVCVSPSRVSLAAAFLRESEIPVCTVIGFPSGAHEPQIKAAEARAALEAGARELDMVINIGALRDGDAWLVEREVAGVRMAIDELDRRLLLKTILESAALSEQELTVAVQAASAGGADFVKTSTGFHPAGGASLEAVRLMRRVAPEQVLVKASGGIRDTETALEMLAAGADRLGLSATRAIVLGLEPASELAY